MNQPSENPYFVSPSEDRVGRLQQLINTHEITIAEAGDLLCLSDYDIVVIADDSGSMNMSSVPPERRTPGDPLITRWEELRSTVRLLVDLAVCFDASGVDVFFLNRPPLRGVKSTNDPGFVEAFSPPPSGTTPLTDTLKRVVQEIGGTERPVLLMIATDGAPDDGPEAFSNLIRDVLAKRITNGVFKFQILACTGDPSSIGWLNAIDKEIPELDVTDDYWSERKEVLAAGRYGKEFRRSDWIIKALLGPVSSKFDCADERIKDGYGKQPSYRAPTRPKDGASNDECCTVL